MYSYEAGGELGHQSSDATKAFGGSIRVPDANAASLHFVHGAECVLLALACQHFSEKSISANLVTQLPSRTGFLVHVSK